VSGGSYEYICFADEIDRLLNKRDQVERMADRLAALGYAKDAAKETWDFLLWLRMVEAQFEARHERLSEVWRAVEWWDSGDSGEDGLQAALEEYRQ
jgi:hypothetical protein